MQSHDEENRLACILHACQRADQGLIHTTNALELQPQELAAAVTAMQAALESARDGIIVVSAEGKIGAANEKFSAMWQIPRNIMELRDYSQIMLALSRKFAVPQQFLQRMEDISSRSLAESMELLELADGRIFELFSKAQANSDQKISRVWSFRDVTACRHTEEALRDEIRTLESLTKMAASLASTFDLDALLQTVIDTATKLSNATFGAFFSNSSKEYGSASRAVFFSEASRDAFNSFGDPHAAALFHFTLNGDSPIRCDDLPNDPRYASLSRCQGISPDDSVVRSYLAVPVMSRSSTVIGGLFLGHAQAAAFTASTQRLVVGIAGHAATAVDNARLYATAQKTIEEHEELLACERTARFEAERLSEMKDQFLATLSHELRTPLNAILGWSQILGRGARNATDLYQGLETIERNARVQTQLIEDLLDMSRITSGKIRLNAHPISPASFIEAAVKTFLPAAEAKGIRLEKQLEAKPGLISGDMDRLQQVISNLVSNAIKFTPKHGTVRVRLTYAESSIEINVSDTGIGIQPDFLPHVFDRFRQADASTTRRSGGLGLGLSIVKHLVELHGGTVNVHSAGEACGTQITVTLPLLVPQKSAAEENKLPSTLQHTAANLALHNLSGIKVLVVDDAIDARDLIERLLTDCQADVVTANGAKEALALIASEPPDVLVSDISMPDVDGLTLIRQVRALRPAGGKAMPAIALTAYARPADRMQALHAGFVAHLSKPIEPVELVATIANIMGRVSDIPDSVSESATHAEASPESVDKAAPMAPVASRSSRVLLVEDSQDFANVMADMLGIIGCEVTVAHDGLTGFERARETHPDLILCDLGLPGIDGFEFARRCRQDATLRAAFIVAMSGRTQPDDHEQAREAGFNKLILKPFGAATLRVLLQSVSS